MPMRVVFKAPGKEAEVREVVIEENILDTVQRLVGNGKNVFVETFGIGPGVTILMDEDGLAKGLPDNCGFVGNIVFVEDVFISEDEGYDWGSLSEESERKALAWCKKHGRDVHPNKDGGFHLITGDKAIEEHQQRVAADVESRVMEWQSL